MATEQNFRSAFNGFNREDVVRYLDYLNTQHQNQVSKLNGEIASLRAQLDTMLMMPQADPQLLEAATKERDALREENASLKEQISALNAELLARQVETPAQQPTMELTGMEAKELETYRRAERVERAAREKAGQVYQQISSVLSQTTQRVEEISGGLTSQADQVMAQLTQLQQAVSCGKEALQEASALLAALHTEL